MSTESGARARRSRGESDSTGPSGSIRPAGFFVLRTPLLSAASAGRALRWPLDRAAVDADEASAIREAIAVASSHLEARLTQAEPSRSEKEGRRLVVAAQRYVLRMCRKPMTYGLCGGISVGEIGPTTELQLAPRARYRRHVRAAHEALTKITASAASAHASTIDVQTNPGLHLAFGQIRYPIDRNERASADTPFRQVTAEADEVLRLVVERAAGGSTREALVDAIVEAMAVEDIARDDATAYVAQLIQNQILVPTVRPPITGIRALRAVQTELARRGAEPAATQLGAIGGRLEELNETPIGHHTERYAEVARDLVALGAGEAEASSLLHVELVKPVESARLGPQVVAELTRVVDLCRASSVLSGLEERPLGEFCARFAERYEGREVPLGQAVDELFEPSPGTPSVREGAPPVFALGRAVDPRGRPGVNLSPRDQFQLKKLLQALRDGSRSIEVRDGEWAPPPGVAAAPLPDSFCVRTRIAARDAAAIDRGEFRLIEPRVLTRQPGFVLGRFGEACPELRAQLAALADEEAALQPDAILAGVACDFGTMALSVRVHPVLRAYEIEYCGRSGAPRERRIPVSDVRVSVAQGRVMLRSQRLGKRILVRIDHAVTRRSRFLPPMYQFLGAVGDQDLQLGQSPWSWGPLAKSEFLPRVVHGKLVLAAARWRLSRSDLRACLDAKSPQAELDRLRSKLRLPSIVCVHEREDEDGLPLDLDDETETEVFLDLLRGKSEVVISENPISDEERVVRGPEGPYDSEIFVPFVCRRDVESNRAAGPARPLEVRGSAEIDAQPVARQLAPGSEVLYAKIYPAKGLAEAVLARIAAPLANRAIETGDAERWFYLFFADPEPHIRLRLAGDPRGLTSRTLPALHEALAPALAEGSVWKVQLDTYEREIERYGGPEGLAIAERVFWADSVASAAVHEAVVDAEDAEGIAWKCAVRGIHGYLEAFGVPPSERRAWMQRMAEAYAGEFAAPIEFHRGIGASFRTHRRAIAAALAAFESTLDPALVEIFRTRDLALASLARELEAVAEAGRLRVPVAQLLASYVHMHAARLFPTALRRQELVLYHLLEKAYAELKFRPGSAP